MVSGWSATSAREWLFWAAIALAVAEFIDAFFIDEPAFAIIYAIVVGLCAWWLRSREGRAAPIVLLILAAIELASVIFIYPNSDNPPGTLNLILFAVLTGAVVVLAAMSLRGSSLPPPTEG